MHFQCWETQSQRRWRIPLLRGDRGQHSALSWCLNLLKLLRIPFDVMGPFLLPFRKGRTRFMAGWLGVVQRWFDSVEIEEASEVVFSVLFWWPGERWNGTRFSRRQCYHQHWKAKWKMCPKGCTNRGGEAPRRFVPQHLSFWRNWMIMVLPVY